MQVTTVGLDLAKNVIQFHGVCSDGTVAFNRSLRPEPKQVEEPYSGQSALSGAF